MSRYAHVCDGVVDTVSLWDGNTYTWQPPDNCVMVPLADDQAVSPGDLYDGQNFTPGEAPQEPVTVAVEVDPAALADLLTRASKATTVAATRTVLTELIATLTPGE